MNDIIAGSVPKYKMEEQLNDKWAGEDEEMNQVIKASHLKNSVVENV